MLQLQWNNAVEDIIDIEVINSLRKYKNIDTAIAKAKQNKSSLDDRR